MSGRQKKRKLQERRRLKAEHEAANRRAEQIQRGEVILADQSKHAPHNSYDPPTEYRDIEFTCIDCRVTEVWTARQQQWWYEVAQGPIHSTAVRCRSCRKKRREQQAQSGDPQPNSD